MSQPNSLGSSPWTSFHDANHILVSSPYIITFGSKTVDIWRVTDGRAPPVAHVSSLSHYVEYPRGEGHAILHPLLGVLAIEVSGQSPEAIWVFSLADGVRLRTVEIYASIDLNTPFLYHNGKVLISVREFLAEQWPGLTSIYHVDVAGDDWLLGNVTFPDTPASPADPLVPVLLTATGDILAIATTPYSTHMTLLLWHGPVLRQDTPLEVSVEIPLTGRDEGCDIIRPGCTMPMGADTFLLAAEELWSDTFPHAFSPQTVLHSIDCTSLETRWRAETVWGEVTALHYLPNHGLVAGVGWRNLSKEGPRDLASFAVVWDAETGACRRLDSIRAAEHGCKLDCFISGEEHPSILAVSQDGKICRTPLEEFINGGFTRREGRLAVHMALPEGSSVIEAATGVQSLVVLSRTASMASDALSRMSYFAW